MTLQKHGRAGALTAGDSTLRKENCWKGRKAGGMGLTTVTNQASFLHQPLLLALVFRAILRKYTELTELKTYLPHPVLGRGKQEHWLSERSGD